MGETRADLHHLLEDLRDAYPGALEETILTEVVANSLDSDATCLRLKADPASSTGSPQIPQAPVNRDRTLKLSSEESEVFDDAEVSRVSSDERETCGEGGRGNEGISLVERGVLTAKIGISRGNRIGKVDEPATAQFGNNGFSFGFTETELRQQFLLGHNGIVDGKMGRIED